jgi:long-chain acyl-CoA synthetase
MKNLYDFLRPSMSAFPDRKAIVCGNSELSYAKLAVQTEGFVRGLQRRGVTPGSKVALLFPCETEFVPAFLAVQQLGAVACPLSIENTESESSQLLGLINPDLVIVSADATDCRNRLTRCWSGVVVSASEIAGGVPGPTIPLRDPDPELEDVAIILCTSGTTGLPKAAMLTHANITANLEAFRDHFTSFPGRDWLEHEVFGNPVPLFHPYGLIMMTLMPLYLSGTAVLIPRFAPGSCLKLIEQHRISFFGAVPSIVAMLNRFSRRSRYDSSSCRIWICGGSPLPKSVAEEFSGNFGRHICEGFGMLEVSSLASNNFECELRHPGSVGPLHHRMRGEIRAEDGSVLPTGELGELWLLGPNVMKGYYRNPSASAEALDEGWLRTGDLGYVDEDGHLYLRGRSKQVIIVGGHNVFPREVENVLLENPYVADAAVAGVSDNFRGERLLAFVTLSNGQAMKEEELLQHCRDSLSTYKVPRKIHVVDAIPRNAAGKIMRQELVQLIREDSPADLTG